MEQKVLTKVAQIAEKVVSSSGSEAPLILLELKDIYQQCPRTSLKTLKVHVWHYGLVHILIELLGQNFTAVGGKWTTAVELATILSHSLTGLQPEKLKKTVQLDVSQIKEYYDDVLPTALHSLLVLANNLLAASTPMLSGLLENIANLCQSHHILITPLIQSPYLLHMLTSASEDSSLHLVLSFIKKILLESPNLLSNLPLEVVLNYMDELVHKITTCSNPLLALEVFSLFLEPPSIAESVTDRYPGLKQFLYSLQVGGSQGVNIRQILEKLGSDFDHAVTVIQSHWRGYCARKKVKAIHRGVIAFQRLYRKIQAKKIQEEKMRCDLVAEDLEQENQHIALRTFHEKQFKIIEQLPAKEVDNFLSNLQQSSATKIQQWWRNRQVKKNKTPGKKPQQSVPPSTTTSTTTTTHGNKSILLFIDRIKRGKLQEEILNYQKQHPVTHRSRASLQQLHSEVQQQLQIMYLDRTLEKERSRKRKVLLNQLEVDSALLLSAPSLEKAQPNTSTNFMGSAHGIIHMAQMAHEEELKSQKLPWWKRTNFDNEEIDLDN